METMHRYAKSIFEPIRRGECVTTVWIPLTGRRTTNNYLVDNIKEFSGELPNYKDFLLVLVDPINLTDASMSGYIRLIVRSIIEYCKDRAVDTKDVDLNYYLEIASDESTSYTKILDVSKELLTKLSDLNYKIVLILGEFDELGFASSVMFGNMKSLWNSLYPNLQYIFLLKERITRREKVYLWGDMNQLLLQNVVYVPLLSDNDVDYIMERFSDELSYDFSDREEEVIRDMCGNHPYLLKLGITAVRNNAENTYSVKEIEDLLSHSYSIESVIRGILDVWNESELEVFKKIKNGESLVGEENKIENNFLKLGLIRNESGRIKFFCKLFEKHIENLVMQEDDYVNKDTLSYDESSRRILYKGKPCDEKFTQQEHMVLQNFLVNIDVIVSRDDIASLLWGEENEDKYSDWAIDQLISKLRKKVSELTSRGNIITIRGRGYKYTLS